MKLVNKLKIISVQLIYLFILWKSFGKGFSDELQVVVFLFMIVVTMLWLNPNKTLAMVNAVTVCIPVGFGIFLLGRRLLLLATDAGLEAVQDSPMGYIIGSIAEQIIFTFPGLFLLNIQVNYYNENSKYFAQTS